MKEHIDEMARIIGAAIEFDELDFGMDEKTEIIAEKAAKKFYNAGYRKQSEGCDFCEAGNEKCGTCVKFFDYYEDGGSDRCSIEYGNEKCAYYKPVHYCSNCGAKMKGGAE